VRRLARDQPAAELAEHGVVEARIVEGQGEGVPQVDPGADGVRGLPVGEVLGELDGRDQGQPPRGPRRAALRREQGHEGRVLVEGPQRVAHPQIEVAGGEGGAGDAGRLVGPGLQGLRAEQANTSCQPRIAAAWAYSPGQFRTWGTTAYARPADFATSIPSAGVTRAARMIRAFPPSTT
jgi:hypothetical protein